MSRTGQPAVRQVAAVERALAVLDALANGQAELGTNEIARRTGINASTVSRLLATLASAGFVEHVPSSGRYRLGLRLLELGNAVLGRLDLREIARPHLQALAALTGETATLSAPGEGHAVTVDFVQSPATVQSVARLGRPSVAHATATGKLLLAFGGYALPVQPERYTDQHADRAERAPGGDRAHPRARLLRGGRRTRGRTACAGRPDLGARARARRHARRAGARSSLHATGDAGCAPRPPGARRGPDLWPRRART